MATVGFRQILTASKSRGILNALHSRNVVTNEAGCFHEAPRKQRFGLIGVALTITAGLTIGSLISKDVASFLEENDLFVPSDDDDD